MQRIVEGREIRSNFSLCSLFAVLNIGKGKEEEEQE